MSILPDCVLLESVLSYPRLTFGLSREIVDPVWFRVGIQMSEKLWFVSVGNADRDQKITVDYKQC